MCRSFMAPCCDELDGSFLSLGGRVSSYEVETVLGCEVETATGLARLGLCPGLNGVLFPTLSGVHAACPPPARRAHPRTRYSNRLRTVHRLEGLELGSPTPAATSPALTRRSIVTETLGSERRVGSQGCLGVSSARYLCRFRCLFEALA